jgi:hypothetical protein
MDASVRTTKSLLALTLGIAASLTVARIHLGLAVFCASLFIIALLSTATWRACSNFRMRDRILTTSIVALALLYLPISGPLYFAVRSVNAYDNPIGVTADAQKFVVNKLFGAPIGSFMRCSPWIHDAFSAYLQSWDDSGLSVYRYFHPLPKDSGLSPFNMAR